MKRAVIVGDGKLHVESALGALTAAGIEAVAAASTAEARALVEAGSVVVVVGVAGLPWEGERAAPFLTMPAPLRRTCVVVLVGPLFATGDGTRAFLLNADLVVGFQDVGRLGELLCAAMAGKRSLVAALDAGAAARLGG